MRLIRGLHNLHHSQLGSALTIGNFDGLHRGHQAVLRHLHERAAERQLATTVMTFEPTAQEYFSPQTAPARLHEAGVGADVPVGLCTHRSVDTVIGALGVMRAGGAYVPIDPTYPALRVTHMLEDMSAGGPPPMILTQRGLAHRFAAHAGTVLCLEDAPRHAPTDGFPRPDCARPVLCWIVCVRRRQREPSALEKLYLSAQGLLEDAFRLGVMVLNSGYRPSFIMAIWRGGTPIGIALQELLDFHGVHCDHIAIRTSSYAGIDGRATEVRIHGMNYLVKNVDHEDRLLIVDDVFDTGHTIAAVIRHLEEKTRLNCPHDIRVAVPYYKPSRNQTGRVPDYYLHETEQWIKFPHSLEGLTEAEIAQHRPAVHEILSRVRRSPEEEHR